MRIQGYVLNLPSCEQRRERIRQQLRSLPLPGHYAIVNAQTGSEDPNLRGILSTGEDGLWRSVLALLKRCQQQRIEADYLHILEDDSTISKQFCHWAKTFQPTPEQRGAVVFTDMFIDVSYFKECLPKAQQLIPQSSHGWFNGEHYTGCTSSWLIPLSELARISGLLQKAFSAPANNRLPLDHCLRQLIHAKQLHALVIFPFLTSVNLDHQLSSSIQTMPSGAVQATNLFNTILRRHLSYCRNADDLQIIGPILSQLLNDQQLDDWLVSLANQLDEQRAFRYLRDPRLLEMHGNPQAEGIR